MPRSEREIFNDHVTVLVRQLGLELESLSEIQRDQLLLQARQQHVNDHEAALIIAYAHLPVLLDDDVEGARVLIDRLALMAREWRDEHLVDARALKSLEEEARDRLRRADR